MKKLFTAVAAALIIAATSSTTVSATRTLNEDLTTKESALEYFNTLRAEAGLSPVTKSEMPIEEKLYEDNKEYIIKWKYDYSDSYGVADINTDGKVDLTDLSELKLYLVKAKEMIVSDYYDLFGCYDVNSDGRVNVMDFMTLKRDIVHMNVNSYNSRYIKPILDRTLSNYNIALACPVSWTKEFVKDLSPIDPHYTEATTPAPEVTTVSTTSVTSTPVTTAHVTTVPTTVATTTVTTTEATTTTVAETTTVTTTTEATTTTEKPYAADYKVTDYKGDDAIKYLRDNICKEGAEYLMMVPLKDATVVDPNENPDEDDFWSTRYSLKSVKQISSNGSEDVFSLFRIKFGAMNDCFDKDSIEFSAQYREKYLNNVYSSFDHADYTVDRNSGKISHALFYKNWKVNSEIDVDYNMCQQILEYVNNPYIVKGTYLFNLNYNRGSRLEKVYYNSFGEMSIVDAYEVPMAVQEGLLVPQMVAQLKGALMNDELTITDNGFDDGLYSFEFEVDYNESTGFSKLKNSGFNPAVSKLKYEVFFEPVEYGYKFNRIEVTNPLRTRYSMFSGAESDKCYNGSDVTMYDIYWNMGNIPYVITALNFTETDAVNETSILLDNPLDGYWVDCNNMYQYK